MNRMRISIYHTSGIALLSAILLSGSSSAATAITEKFTDSWGAQGFTLTSQSSAGIDLVFSLSQITFSPATIDGELMQAVSFPCISIPGRAGAPDLPSMSRLIAIPTGAIVHMEIVACRKRMYHDINLIPAAEIPREDEVQPSARHKDPSIYKTDADYPPSPVEVSRTAIRGVEAVLLSVIPFSYNPVSRELTVYTDLRLSVTFTGGGNFGEERLRGRWWEPMLRQHLLNYSSLSPFNDIRYDQGDEENCEYLIITPDDPAFLAWADTIRQWREEEGVITGVVPLSQIGGNDTTAIREYLRNAYETWAIPPQAVLLLADFQPQGHDAGIASPLLCGYITDNLFADMDGDILPDLILSRLAVEDETQLAVIIGKMLSYERSPSTDPNFYQYPLLTSSWYQNFWFLLCEEVIYGYMHDRLGKDPVREYCLGDGSLPDSIWSTGPNTGLVTDYFGPSGLNYIPATPAYLTDWSGNAAGINQALNSGSFLVQYRGHGWVYGWCLPAYGTSNLTGLTNPAYPYIISTCCWTGNFSNANPCFAEAFQRMEHGALGLTAATAPTNTFVNDVFVWGMYDYFWSGFDPGYGSGSPEETHLLPAFAVASGKYYLEASSWPPDPMAKLTTICFFEHLGETFMRLYSQPPEVLSVDHDSVLQVSATTLSVNAEVGSLIALSRGGNLLARAEGTGAPVNLPLPALSIGQQVRVTVTKDNHYRYIADVPVTGSLNPVSLSGGGGPFEFALAPARPNPFNASTVTSYELLTASHVSLKVYDTAGRLVATVVDGWRETGQHQATFDGSKLATGIYLLNMQAGDFTAIQKLALLK